MSAVQEFKASLLALREARQGLQAFIRENQEIVEAYETMKRQVEATEKPVRSYAKSLPKATVRAALSSVGLSDVVVSERKSYSISAARILDLYPAETRLHAEELLTVRATVLKELIASGEFPEDAQKLFDGAESKSVVLRGL